MYTIWCIRRPDSSYTLALPNSDGTVTIAGNPYTQAEWKELRSQINELYEIAAKGEEA